jgi:hypothetical protein
MSILSDLVSTVSPKHLFSDEKVQWAKECTHQRPGLGLVRVQILCVMRDGKPVTFGKVLGLASEFPHTARDVFFPAFGLYSAGEAVDILQMLRESRPMQEREPTDLMGAWYREQDELNKLRKHITTSGPYQTVQRD